MANYCFVENDKLVYAGHLPKSWRNVSGLEHLDDAGLAKIGWLPMEEIHPEYDELTHRREGQDMDVQADKVVFTDNIIAFTAQEMKQNKWNDWTSGLSASDDNNVIGINRVMEDVIDSLVRKYPDILNDSENARLKQRHKAKKDLRATKPTNPNE